MADRRGPVYPQGAAGPDSWRVVAKNDAGSVVAIARHVRGQDAADKLLARWLRTPAVGATSGSATEEDSGA